MLEKLMEGLYEAWMSNTIVQSLVENVAEIVISGLSLVVSIGAGIWSFCTTKRLKKQEAELQKQIDKANSINERLTHINNNQFDYTFEICKEMSEVSFTMMHYFGVCVQRILLGAEDKEILVFINNAASGFYEYRDRFFKYAPFVPDELYDKFQELLENAVAFSTALGNYEKRQLGKEFWESHYEDIALKHGAVIVELRSYLQRIAKGETNE